MVGRSLDVMHNKERGPADVPPLTDVMPSIFRLSKSGWLVWFGLVRS